MCKETLHVHQNKLYGRRLGPLEKKVGKSFFFFFSRIQRKNNSDEKVRILTFSSELFFFSEV